VVQVRAPFADKRPTTPAQSPSMASTHLPSPSLPVVPRQQSTSDPGDLHTTGRPGDPLAALPHQMLTWAQAGARG
jgi:hypothetical protein